MTSDKGAGTRFKRGQSGNPAGAIKSLTPARRALARELGVSATEIIATTVRLAIAGDAHCCAALVSILAGGFEAPPASKNAAAAKSESNPRQIKTAFHMPNARGTN